MRPISRVALVGAGVIGSGWAARILFRGLDVAASDPAPGAEERLRDAVARAGPALDRLSLVPRGRPGTLRFEATVEAAVADADFVQENAPEDEDLKRGLLARIGAAAPRDAVIASSSSGFLPTRLQADCRAPERVLIGHPFNPVYLLPLVEVVAGERTSQHAVERASAFYRSIGMHVLRVRCEVEGYISDRLQEALWREALHIVADGIATTDEIDRAITYGPGLRWAFMGPGLTNHLAGGAGGMGHMLEQFGPALERPWTGHRAPPLTGELIDRLVEGTAAQAAGRSIQELERTRDGCLVAIMQALRAEDYGAGQVLREDDARAYADHPYRRFSPDDDLGRALRLWEAQVRPAWVDYNGHMTESRYLQVFGDAADALFRYIGVDDAYHARGYSFYTVETHINHMREASAFDPLYVTTQVLGVDAKRLHIFHSMHRGDTDEQLAAAEQMVIHVDVSAARACPTRPEVRQVLARIRAAHRDLPDPPQKGRVIAIPDTGA